jgi:formate hydrogenlyase transcriptional activator
MWVWDAESLRFLAANEAAISHCGYSQDEFLAVRIEGIRPATEAQSLSKFLSKSLTGIGQVAVCKFHKKDGTLIDVEIHNQPINWAGKPAHLVVTNDITGRTRTEHALRDSEERVRLILASAAEAIFGCDPVGTCIFCNDAAAQLLGYDHFSELLGKNMHTTEHHTRADGTPYPLDECPIYLGFQIGHGIHRDDEIFWRKDGTSFPVEYWSHLTVQDGKTLCVVTFMDITERRQAAQALRKSEERWRAVFENSAIGVALTDLNGRFLAVNRAYEKMLGYTEEELRKLTFPEITEEDYRGFNGELISDLLEGKRQQFQIEKQYRCKDGSLRWVSNNVSLVPGTESMPRFIMALSEDITERRQAEEALRRSAERKRTLLEINNAIITILTREALFQSVSDALHHVIDFDRSALTLYEPLTDSLRFVAYTGNPLQFRIGDELKRTDSTVGWVFDHRQPIVRGDLEKEQQYLNERHLIGEGMRSHCIAPLIVRGKSIGTLNIASKTRCLYSEMDAQFLQEVANQVALAIENMKSYEEISELKARLEKENVYLQEEIRTEHNFEEIVGNSPALLAALRKVEQVAPTDSTVLIYGETGTGKELIARAIHNRSARKDRPLVKVNCSAISAGLVESELFGHVKGAFTGAIDRRIGRFELADGGTIFLDEIGELPLETQVKLLRVLQEREFEPVGSSRPLRADVRVIAATNRDLEESIQSGRFRSDLFYRLNVFPLEAPPLRERRSDIPILTKFFLSSYSKKLGKNIKGISQATMDRILGYSWPGNVRELQNIIERAVVLSQGRILELQQELAPSPLPRSGQGMADKPAEVAQEASLPASEFATLKEVERSHILAALKRTLGVIEGPKGAARILNLHPNTLRHRMEKFGIKRSAHDPS